ncbi:hypothetical protein SNEBB_011217 [Seison nebaliae]|nr:hypothetical protein SNEBB_011217 [Seison nebaliae]
MNVVHVSSFIHLIGNKEIEKLCELDRKVLGLTSKEEEELINHVQWTNSTIRCVTISSNPTKVYLFSQIVKDDDENVENLKVEELLILSVISHNLFFIIFDYDFLSNHPTFGISMRIFEKLSDAEELRRKLMKHLTSTIRLLEQPLPREWIFSGRCCFPFIKFLFVFNGQMKSQSTMLKSIQQKLNNFILFSLIVFGVGGNNYRNKETSNTTTTTTTTTVENNENENENRKEVLKNRRNFNSDENDDQDLTMRILQQLKYFNPTTSNININNNNNNNNNNNIPSASSSSSSLISSSSNWNNYRNSSHNFDMDLRQFFNSTSSLIRLGRTQHPNIMMRKRSTTMLHDSFDDFPFDLSIVYFIVENDDYLDYISTSENYRLIDKKSSNNFVPLDHLGENKSQMNISKDPIFGYRFSMQLNNSTNQLKKNLIRLRETRQIEFDDRRRRNQLFYDFIDMKEIDEYYPSKFCFTFTQFHYYYYHLYLRLLMNNQNDSSGKPSHRSDEWNDQQIISQTWNCLMNAFRLLLIGSNEKSKLTIYTNRIDSLNTILLNEKFKCGSIDIIRSMNMSNIQSILNSSTFLSITDKLNEELIQRILPSALSLYKNRNDSNGRPNRSYEQHKSFLKDAINYVKVYVASPIQQYIIRILEVVCMSIWFSAPHPCSQTSFLNNSCLQTIQLNMTDCENYGYANAISMAKSRCEHQSKFTMLIASSCGNFVGTKSDCFDLIYANFTYYQNLSNKNRHKRKKRHQENFNYLFPIFIQPSTNDEVEILRTNCHRHQSDSSICVVEVMQRRKRQINFENNLKIIQPKNSSSDNLSPDSSDDVDGITDEIEDVEVGDRSDIAKNVLGEILGIKDGQNGDDDLSQSVRLEMRRRIDDEEFDRGKNRDDDDIWRLNKNDFLSEKDSSNDDEFQTQLTETSSQSSPISSSSSTSSLFSNKSQLSNNRIGSRIDSSYSLHGENTNELSEHLTGNDLSDSPILKNEKKQILMRYDDENNRIGKSKSADHVKEELEENDEEIKEEKLVFFATAGVLTTTMPSETVPLFNSWNLEYLGKYFVYSHGDGIQQVGFMKDAQYLNEWDFPVEITGDSNNRFLRIYVGIEYECPDGHRHLYSAKRSSDEQVNEKNRRKRNKSLFNNEKIPLYTKCPCDSHRWNDERTSPTFFNISQIARFYIVLPKRYKKDSIGIRPIIQINNTEYTALLQPISHSNDQFRHHRSSPEKLSEAKPIPIPSGGYWVLRFPHFYGKKVESAISKPINVKEFKNYFLKNPLLCYRPTHRHFNDWESIII